MQNSFGDTQQPNKRRKLNQPGVQFPSWHSPPRPIYFQIPNRKRKLDGMSCRQEMLKKPKKFNYSNRRHFPIDKYDFLIISSMPNCIHRYIK